MIKRFYQSYFLDSAKPFFDEWLEANGLGGYAGSTLSGMNTRRYHGLLVAATAPPVGREVLVSKIEEQIKSMGEIYKLSCNEFDRSIYFEGRNYLKEFTRDLFPTWTFSCGNVIIKKKIACIHNKNTTVVMYEMVEGEDLITLQLRPLLTARSYHSLRHKNDFGPVRTSYNGSTLSLRFEKENKDIFISGYGFNFEYGPHWYDNFTLPRERERGFDDSEDLYMPGIISVQLGKGKEFGLVLSTDPEEILNPFLLFEDEKKRREKLVEGISNESIKKLTLAADQFIVRRGEDKRTIIAGYPWFGDWGRDTMIALQGLCHATGRMSDSEKILSEFRKYVSEGMLPNLFPDGQNNPEYNTIDGTLWYFVAIYDYLRSGGNLKKITQEFLPVLGEIIEWHLRGTRYGIKEDEDGLLKGGDQSIQLTWMDARVDERVITPRSGKAVEINALWYNAIRIYAHLLRISGDEKKAAGFERRAVKIRKSFMEKFWNEKANCLFDVIDNEWKDESIRPNQLFAVSLPFPLLKGEKAKSVLEVVTKSLLTPTGIRSLAPDSTGYRPYYNGNNVERDEAYHQGTVWSWLLGPYIDALINLEGDSGKVKAEEILNTFMPHLDEACVGNISEIFDAAHPHYPKGAVAQAWSVGEILRVIKRHDLNVSEDKKKLSRKNVLVG